MTTARAATGRRKILVAQGAYRDDGVFVAREVLAKHDEKYMPKEVSDALKKSGQWRGGPDGGASASGGSQRP